MNGPEHYKAAEQLIVMARDSGYVLGGVLAAAQVHATLALAAATALPASQRWLGDESRADSAWVTVST